MKDYPFVKCLNPQRIVNPYTKQSMVVPCGHCDACEVSKCDQRTLQCEIESLSHSTCMFVCLTYSNKYCPRCQAFYDDSFQGHVIKDDTPRLQKYNGLYRKKLAEIPTSQSDMDELRNKVQSHNLPYLCKRDLQLFIKRLRKHLFSYTNEKIRYFAVGEYAPKHFRPHFHLLIWFDQEQTRKNFREALSKAWTYGRISCEVSRGECASYTSSYLNSFSCLPLIYQSNELKPFCCHSARLGHQFFEGKKEEVYAMPPADFNRRSVPLNGHNTDVFLWRSFTSRYFPRCRNYALCTERERFFAYTLYAETFRWTREVSPYRQTKAIITHIYQYGFHHFVPEYDRILKYFSTTQRFSTKKLCRCDKEAFEQMFNSIYHDLYVSKHFLHFVCDTPNGRSLPYLSEINRKLQLIDNYYKQCEYDNLKNQMSVQEELITSELYECEEVVFDTARTLYEKVDKSTGEILGLQGTAYCIPFIYGNSAYDLNRFQSTWLPRMFREDTFKRKCNSVKHKELNDLNDRFKDK